MVRTGRGREDYFVDICQAAPQYPAPYGARVRVDGYGEGNYVRFRSNWVGRLEHQIMFDDGQPRRLRGSRCNLIRLITPTWDPRAKAAPNWTIFDDGSGSATVSTVIGQTIDVEFAQDTTIREFKSTLAGLFGIQIFEQHLSFVEDHDTVCIEDVDSPLWAAGVRDGTRLMLSVVGENQYPAPSRANPIPFSIAKSNDALVMKELSAKLMQWQWILTGVATLFSATAGAVYAGSVNKVTDHL